MNSPTITGVRKMPITLDRVALHTAAGTLPRAMEVKAIEDCTVEGSRHRNSTPAVMPGLIQPVPSARMTRPSTGNRTKVEAATSRCRRQWPMPAMIASRDSLAPCRKNNRVMAALVIQPNTTAPSPRQGRTLAKATVPTRNIRKGSSPGSFSLGKAIL